MTISWTPGSAGVEASGFSVDYTSNGGTSWTTVMPTPTTGTSVTTDALPNGTYGARITPQTSGGLVGAPSYTETALVISDSGTTEGSGSGTENETGGTTGTSTSSSSSGGAALWLLALPLLAVRRRRSATR